MEVSTEKSKIMLNSTANTRAKICMNRQQLEEVDTFKYLGSTLTKDGRSTTEIKTRLAIATSAMGKMSKIWKRRSASRQR
jgi:hypothetical protein